MLTTWNFTVVLVSALHCKASKSLSSYVVIIKWLLLPKSSWSCLATRALDGMCIHENLTFVSAGTLTAHVTCILWPSQDSTNVDELNLLIKRSEKNKAHNGSKANICLSNHGKITYQYETPKVMLNTFRTSNEINSLQWLRRLY